MLIIGFSLIVFAAITGEADVALFLIFPVIYGGGWLMLAGIVLVFISFILFFMIPFQNISRKEEYREHKGWAEEEGPRESKYGGVIFIGPIPIVFGKDKDITQKMLYMALILVITLIIVYYIFTFTI